MKINCDYAKYSIMIIENLFSEQEIKIILNECNHISKNIGLWSPEETGTAYYEDGISSKRKSSSICLDQLVTKKGRYMSSILKILDSKLYETSVIDKFIEINPSNLIIKNTNSHTTLLNYYEEDDHYDFHKDSNVFTILHIFYEEPKSFNGGDIVFKVNDEELPIKSKNNLSIIFPAAYDHKVTSISMKPHNEERMMGRFSFVQFLNIVQ